MGDVLDEDVLNPSAFGPCCDAVTGTFVIPLTVLTSSVAQWEDTFESFCEGLDLHVLAELRLGEVTCEFEVRVRPLNNGTEISIISFQTEISLNSNCAAFNNLALDFSSYSSSASMACVETSNGCTVTAV